MRGEDTHGQEIVVGDRPSEAVADQEEILLRGLSLNGEARGLLASNFRQPPRGPGGQGRHPELVRGRVPVACHHPGDVTEASHLAEHFLPECILVFPEVRDAEGPAIDVYDVHLGAAGAYHGIRSSAPRSSLVLGILGRQT